MKYVFGPVPSRRLGRSLGVDVVPMKTCTYDCIYCQLGRTTCATMERQEWAPLDALLAEVREKLDSRPDYITISGSGEPTLYSRVGELIDGIRSMTSIPVAVLTNGSLLWDDAVEHEVAAADLVLPSLDAGTAEAYERVNRPHSSIPFEHMLQGLVDFRGVFQGAMWLEVFLVDGYTANAEEIERLVEAVEKIAPDRVQLNTVTRPPSESFAGRVPARLLREYAARFTPPGEVIAEFSSPRESGESCATCEDVLNLLRRRPCTLADIAEGMQIHLLEATKHLEVLAAELKIEAVQTNSKVYYRALERL